MSDIDNLRRLAGWDIFDCEVNGFKIVLPGVAFTRTDVNVDLVDGSWVLTYCEDGHVYTGTGESQVGAYLALIGDRYGLIVDTRPKPEPAEDGS